MSTPTTIDDAAAIETLMSLGHNPRNYDQPVLPVRHPSSSTSTLPITYASTSRSISGSPSFASTSASSPYGPLTGLPVSSIATTTITASSSSSRSCSLPLPSSVPPISNTTPRHLQSGVSSRSIPGSRLNERKGSGRLSGPGSRDILDFRGDGDGDGNGVGDGFVGDGYGDVRSDEAGDEGGDSDNHRSTNIPEPGVDVEDEADVRTIRGFGGPDEDDIRNTRIRIGIGDVKRYDGGDLEGGDSGGGGDTDIRDMIRVRGEDPHLHLRSRSEMTLEVDLRPRSGMEVDLNMDRNRDRNRDMLMRMDPDMVRVLKSIYGWGDRELQAIGTRHLQIWSQYPDHPESAGWRKRLPYIRFKRKRKIKMEVVSSDGSGEEEVGSGSHSEEAEFGCIMCPAVRWLLPHPLESKDDLNEIRAHLANRFHKRNAATWENSAPIPGIPSGLGLPSPSLQGWDSETPSRTKTEISKFATYRGEKRSWTGTDDERDRALSPDVRKRAKGSTPQRFTDGSSSSWRTDDGYDETIPSSSSSARRVDDLTVLEHDGGEEMAMATTSGAPVEAMLHTPPRLVIHGAGGDFDTADSKGPNPSLDGAPALSSAISDDDYTLKLQQLAERQTTDFTTETNDDDAQLSKVFSQSMNIDPAIPEEPPKEWFKLTPQSGVVSDWRGAYDVLKDGLRLEYFEDKGEEDLTRYWLSSMKTPLLPVQVFATASIWSLIDRYEARSDLGKGMLLADDIGLGKTTVALSILARDRARGSKRSTLVLCPAGLESTTWKASPDAEIGLRLLEDFSNCVRIVNSPESWIEWMEERIKERDAPPKTRVTIITFKFLRRYLNRPLPVALQKRFSDEQASAVTVDNMIADRVIIDEVQNITRPQHVLGPEIAKLCSRASFTLLVSATPFHDDAKQAYLTLMMIGANKYDSFEVYTKAMPKRKKGETSRAETLEWLCRQMKSPEIYMARDLKDPKYTRPANLQELVIDCEVVPDQNRTIRVFNSLFVKLLSAEPRMKKTADQSAMDATIAPSDPVSWMASMACLLNLSAKAALQFMQKIPPPDGLGLAKLQTRLQEDAKKGVVYAKAENLVTLLRDQQQCETFSRDKSLVLGWYEAGLEVMVSAIEAAGYVRWTSTSAPSALAEGAPGHYVLHSPDMARAAKDQALSDLKEQPSVKILVGLIGALDEGKNLQICNHMYLMELPRSPDQLRQLQGRIQRHPQSKLCRTVRLCTRDTIDSLLDNIILARSRGVGTGFHPILQYGDMNRFSKLLDKH